MNARYAGSKCVRCGLVIHVGDDIVRAGAHWNHVDCTWARLKGQVDEFYAGPRLVVPFEQWLANGVAYGSVPAEYRHKVAAYGRGKVAA